MTTKTTMQSEYISKGMKAASAMLSITPDEIRLACGEISPEEMRTILAVLEWRRKAIIRKAESL